MPLPDFQPFNKIPRLSRDMVVTEKLDGTNASVLIRPYEPGDEKLPETLAIAEAPFDIGGATRPTYSMFAGSRTRWLQPTKQEDNYGFAAWVKEHADELFNLGEGTHHGEWWGRGVQRGYGLTEKRFSLFNVGRWYDLDGAGKEDITDRILAPAPCRVVPVLLRGPFSTKVVEDAVVLLRIHGSFAAPGFMDPEGIIVWHESARQMFKKTIRDDDAPKSLAKPDPERIADKLIATSAAALASAAI